MKTNLELLFLKMPHTALLQTSHEVTSNFKGKGSLVLLQKVEADIGEQ